MTIHYNAILGLPPGVLLSSMLDLLAEVFSNQSRSALLADLNYHQTQVSFLTLLAVEGKQIIGCKLGYERKPGHFYSWLGCVSPAHRGQGIAAELLDRQHDWCRANNYHTIRTQTYNQWRSMLLLNLRHGFDIIGTVQGEHGLTIVLEKPL